jgi:uroporphyrinogen III methyltransferase/synthase
MVLITRALPLSSGFRRKIEDSGGEVIGYPTLKIVNTVDLAYFKRVTARSDHYEWVIFSSANGVAAFFEALHASGDMLPQNAKVAVIGAGTGAAFEQRAGRRADFVPLASTGKGLAAEFFRRHGRTGMRVLLPGAAERQGALENVLREHGIEVEALVVYTTVRPAREELPVWDGQADAVVFTSPKAAQFFLELASVPPEATVVAIGPSTTEYLSGRGIMPVFEPLQHDLDGIGEVLHAIFR